MKTLAESRIAIVGLGLMGGSLAGALRGRCRQVIGVARREETVAVAQARHLVDHGTTDLAQAIRDADVVVLATPVRTILRLLPVIGSLLPSPGLVMDVGSTKREIVAAMEHLPPHIQPLGGHPMCGRECSGIEAADPTLYHGCTFILTPLARTSPQALALGTALVKAAGARPLLLDAERHDRLVALLSHLPYLVACALVATANVGRSADPLSWQVAAGGFRDTSRLAGSDVTMMMDILLTNRDWVRKAMASYEREFRRLRRLLESGDEGDLRAALEAIRAIRQSIPLVHQEEE